MLVMGKTPPRGRRKVPQSHPGSFYLYLYPSAGFFEGKEVISFFNLRITVIMRATGTNGSRSQAEAYTETEKRLKPWQ